MNFQELVLTYEAIVRLRFIQLPVLILILLQSNKILARVNQEGIKLRLLPTNVLYLLELRIFEFLQGSLKYHISSLMLSLRSFSNAISLNEKCTFLFDYRLGTFFMNCDSHGTLLNFDFSAIILHGNLENMLSFKCISG